MEIKKEGLRQYCVEETVENEYFLSTEYPMLRYNHLKTLLPVQLREQDGNCTLLYDITGCHSIDQFAGGRGFSFQDCRNLLKSMLLLLQEIEEFMLEIEHISFSSDRIYLQEERFQWMYLPEGHCDIKKEMEDFFAWMLSKMDYEDFKGVTFIYHVFWCVRNQSFSKKMIQECLDFPIEESMEETIPYEMFFSAKEENKEKEMYQEQQQAAGAYTLNQKQQGSGMSHNITEGRSESQGSIELMSNTEPQKRRKISGLSKKTEKNIHKGNPSKGNVRKGNVCKGNVCKGNVQGKKKRNLEKPALLWMEILFILFSCGDFAILLLLFLEGIRADFPMLCVRYMIGCSLLLVLFLCSIFWIQCRRNQSEEDCEDGELFLEQSWNLPVTERMDFPDYNWEEEGTVVLGARKDLSQPAIKILENGEIHLIKTFPYYIGSGPEMNQLVLRDLSVSRQHAVILRGKQTGTYMVQDLTSTNGSWIEEKKMQAEVPVLLKNKMILQFASTRVQFLIMEKAESRAS